MRIAIRLANYEGLRYANLACRFLQDEVLETFAIPGLPARYNYSHTVVIVRRSTAGEAFHWCGVIQH